MRHGVFGKKLSRTVNERRRLFMVLAQSLVMHGRIKTSLAKAKAVQPIVEGLITKVKHGKTSDLREVRKMLSDKKSIATLSEQAKTRFGNRVSGYTRIIRLGVRTGDASETVLLEFVDALPSKEVAAKVEKPQIPHATKGETPVKKTKSAKTGRRAT